MSGASERVKRHQLRAAAGIVVVPVEVGKPGLKGLEDAGLLPRDGDHTREEITAAIEELLRRLSQNALIDQLG